MNPTPTREEIEAVIGLLAEGCDHPEECEQIAAVAAYLRECVELRRLLTDPRFGMLQGPQPYRNAKSAEKRRYHIQLYGPYTEAEAASLPELLAAIKASEAEG